MKKLFLTGLALLLPAVLTVMILLFIVNLLTKPFVGILEETLSYFDLLDTPILFFKARDIVLLFSKVIILIGLVAATVFMGILARIFFFNTIIKLGNVIIHKIPFINKIYKATQDVITTLFQEKGPSFSDVVLVPFPTAENYCIGLVTNAPEQEDPALLHGEISVFVPATPNPTMGFMILYRKNQLIPLDMTVEEALKFIVSCGVMSKDFSIKEARQ